MKCNKSCAFFQWALWFFVWHVCFVLVSCACGVGPWGFRIISFFLAVGFLMCMQVTCFGCMCVIIFSFLVFLGVDAQINVRVIARVH